MLLKPELVDATGPLQTCAGRAGGIDADIHATRDIFDDDETEYMLPLSMILLATIFSNSCPTLVNILVI